MTVTQKYILFSLSIVALVWWAISVTYISSNIEHLIGVDPLKLLGNGAVLGPKKLKILEYASYVGMACLAVGYIVTLPHSGRGVRFVVVIFVAPLILVSNAWLDITPMSIAQARIHIQRLPTVDYDTIFSDDAIQRSEIISFEGFRVAVNNNFEKHRAKLKKTWNIEDEQTLRALFYLNTVANMFSFGNTIKTAPGGCAARNENTNGKTRNFSKLGINFYTQSEIGCCTDYALLIGYLLDGAGIENHLLALNKNGHFFNEAFLNEKWHTLDGNIGAFYDKDWNTIVDSQAPFSVTVFPVRSLNGNNPKYYRPLLAQFRHRVFMIAATGNEYTQIDDKNRLKFK